MPETRIRPARTPATEGERPTLTPETLAAIDSAAAEAEREAASYLSAEIRARLEHVALHIPEGDTQDVILRTKPAPPFFEVTTERAR